MKSDIKAVIFDMDGTLANTLPLCIKAFRLSVEPLVGRILSDAEIIATFGPSEEGTIMALAPGHYNKGIAAYLKNYHSLHYMCAAPFAGIRELLEVLQTRGIPVAMVTGKGQHSTAISLRYLGLASYFKIIETGSPNGARKAEGIRLIAEQLRGIAQSEIIYVGDSAGDITASREAGIRVVAAAWADTADTEELKKLKPDQLFCSVHDFSAWIIDRL